MGFGQGPRACIGMRFALLESKMALAHVMSKFTLKMCDDTPKTIVYDPYSTLGGPNAGLWVKGERREQSTDL